MGVLLLLLLTVSPVSLATTLEVEGCAREIVLTVLNGDTDLLEDEEGRPFGVQDLRLEIVEAPHETQKYEGPILHPARHGMVTNGIFNARLGGEGAHRTGSQMTLPPAMLHRLVQAAAAAPRDISNAGAFVSYLEDVPLTAHWNEIEIPEGYEPKPGTIVGVGGETGKPVWIAGAYLGEGLYATWIHGVVVCDLRSMMRGVNAENIRVMAVERASAVSSPSYGVFQAMKPFHGVSSAAYAEAWAGHTSWYLSRPSTTSEQTVHQWLLGEIHQNTSQGRGAIRLGYTVNRIDSGEETLAPPTLDEFLKNYDALLNAEIAAGKLKEADTFRFGRAFRNWRGKHVYTRWDETPPDGFYEIDPTRLPQTVIGNMLAMGLMPISIGRSFHDSRHFDAFAAYPQTYMKPLRALVRNARKLPRDERNTRVFYALETLSLVPKENWPKLRPLIAKILRKDTETIVTVSEVFEILQREPIEGVVAQARALLAALPDILDNYGGAPRDPLVSIFTSGTGARENPKGMSDRLALFLDHREEKRLDVVDPHEPALVLMHGGLDGLIRHQLARLQVMLRESTRITPATFFKELLEVPTRKNGHLFRMFLLSGVSNDLDGPEPYADDSLARSLYRTTPTSRPRR